MTPNSLLFQSSYLAGIFTESTSFWTRLKKGHYQIIARQPYPALPLSITLMQAARAQRVPARAASPARAAAPPTQAYRKLRQIRLKGVYWTVNVITILLLAMLSCIDKHSISLPYYYETY